MASFEFVLLGLVDDNTPPPIWIDREPRASASSLRPVTEDADNDNHDVENPSPATGVGANDGDNNEPETVGQSIRSFFVILMYMIVAMTLGSLIAVCGLVIVVFCIFPIFLLVSILLCANYCSGAEPLPFFHLLRHIFQGDDPDFNPSPEKTKAKKKRYRPRLIVRKLVRIEDRDDDDDNNNDDDDGHDGDAPENTAKNDNDDVNENQNQNHAEDDDESSRVLIIDKDKHPPTPQSNTLQRKTKRPIEIRTEGKSFCFSAPLDASNDGPEEEAEDAADNDDENGGSENENENEATADDAPSGGDARDANGDDHGNSGGDGADGDASGSDRDENRSSNNADAGAIPTEEGGIELTAMDRGAASAVSGDGGDLETGDGENENDVETDRVRDCDCTCSNSNSNPTGGPIVPLPDEEAMTPKDLLMRVDDDDDDDDNDREHREVTCDICMLEFKVGDEIAWSPNVLCNHSFHKECILEWLVRKPTCPVCRQDYV